MSPEKRQPYQFSLKDVIRLAQEAALRDGYHVPTIIAQVGEIPIISQIPQLPPTHEERMQLMFAAGLALARTGEAAELKQVIFISEGWMSSAAEDGTIDRPPSQDPDRREVLVVTSLEVEVDKADMVIFEMVRNEEGALTNLELIALPKAGDSRAESPLLEAFVAGFRQGIRGKVN